jgi:type IV pilus assembly protein PilE
MTLSIKYKICIKSVNGFSLTELMVVLVIIGVLVLLALPKLLPIVTKAKTTEAKLMLKQVYTLEQSYKFEHDHYSQALPEIGFEQDKLISQGGQARYKIDIPSADEKSFLAQATSTVDFNDNGTFNVWVVDETGSIKEKVPDRTTRKPPTSYSPFLRQKSEV